MSFPENLSDRARGLIIAIAGLVLIVTCWKAPFLNYDDGSHITDNAQVMKPLNLGELFTQPSDYKFFPITILSYRLDRMLFESWMPGLLGSWAPGVRTMSLLYHAGTALLVWQILLLLGVGRSVAYFSGLVFAKNGGAFHSRRSSISLKYLANLRLNQQLPAEAFALMQESVRYFPSDPEARYLRAYAALTLLQKEPAHPRRAEILLIARTDLDSISPDMPIHKEAQELMRSPLLKNAAGN